MRRTYDQSRLGERMEMQMATAATSKPSAPTGQEPDHTVEKKIQQLGELRADAAVVGRNRVNTALRAHKRGLAVSRGRGERAGCGGPRLGKVSELTIIVPLAPGGAKRLRAFLRLLKGNLSQGANKVG